MALVEILDVALTELDAEQLRGRNIEFPKVDSRIDSDTMVVIGWVLGRSSPAVTVEVVHDGAVLQSAPIDVQRQDITDAFPRVPGTQQSGFRTNVAIPNSGEFELLVRAVLQDEETVSLGIIRARQRRGDEEQYGENSIQDRSGPLVRERSGRLERFFRRLSGWGGG
jgi:O-antigen biosynthesis protein